METSAKIRFLIPTLVLVLLLAIGGWYWYANMRAYVSTDDALVDSYQSTISPKMLGKIESLEVKEGDYVKAGQILVKMDDSDLRAAENQNQANIAYTQESVIKAKVDLDKAQEDFERGKTQFKDGSLAQQDYDHLEKTLESARAAYAIALAQVKNGQTQLGVTETQLQSETILAPIEGVISKRWVMPGDIVQPSQPIFSLFDVKHVWITANFEETKIAALRLGEPAEISVDAYPGILFEGHVSEVGSNTAAQFSLIPPNNASGNFTKVTQRVPIKIAVDTHLSGKPLLPGMSVELKVKVR
ncbi:MAG TPA: hypothetical protein DDW50_19125 [Firmicutes bacterium]|jgi:membrane fusion protein, multidrug efflux system|nr:hypothetical protein [Bacillota bacterium]